MPGGQRHAPKPGQARPSQHRPRQAVAGGSPEIGRDEDRIADVIGPVIAAAGMDLESVRVSAAGRRRLLRVVVDSDRGVSLDDAAAISRELWVSEHTIKFHLTNIYRKLGVPNRAGAVRYALDHGLV